MYQTAEDERIVASVQTAMNKIHSIRRYLIWFHDNEPEETVKIIRKARAEVAESNVLDYSLEIALEYSEKWEEFYKFFKTAVREVAYNDEKREKWLTF